MERLVMKRFVAWKESPYRKPLILKGGPSGRQDVAAQGTGAALL